MIYVMVENLSGSVIRSQVLFPLMEISRYLDLDIDLLAMERHATWEREGHLDSLRRELSAQRVRLHAFLHYGNRHPLTYLNLARMLLTLCGLLIGNRQRRIMARNFHSAFLAIPFRLLFPRSRLLLDLRGVFVHELVLRGAVREGGILHRALTWMERQSFGFSDHILCVSEQLTRYVIQTLGREKATSVIPCCVDANFFDFNSVRQRELTHNLGLAGKFVVVYAGSLTSWNLLGPMLDLFAVVQRSQPDAHFLFMTPAIEQARDAFHEQGFPNKCYTVTSVPHQEIKDYIALGDLALLLRGDNLVNRVASPVKLGEYVACGVPVCITPYVGDLSDLVTQRQIGAALDLADPCLEDRLATLVSDVRRNRELYRERCVEFGRSYFDRRRYDAAYGKLIQGDSL
jgi:glycosyltransferase involved in cell wall biosynthesis